MKRLVIGLVVAIAVMAGIAPPTAHALPPDFIFEAHGVVTENGLPVEGASIFVECGPDGVPGGTNADGSYHVSFGACFLGSTVYIRAAKGNSYGSASVLGTHRTTLNVEISEENAANTIIRGNVSDHGHVVRGAKVTMTCGSVQKETVTDNHGEYLFAVPPGNCPVGTTVQVTASEGGRSGTITTEVKRTNNIIIAIANVGIPEYGLLGGTLAAVAGVGVIALTRRRLLKQGSN